MTPFFQTLDELYLAAEGHQTNLQEIIDNRAYVFGQYQDIEISQELKNTTIDLVVEIIGGTKATKEILKNKLLWGGKLRHWSFFRFVISKYYEDKSAKFEYCCGQDWDSEIKDIKKFLKSR